jgi:hypothetical protein
MKVKILKGGDEVLPPASQCILLIFWTTQNRV